MTSKTKSLEKGFSHFPELNFVRPRIDHENTSIFMYAHFTTPLIRPHADFIMEYNGIFAYRSFRLPYGFRATILPEFNESDIWRLLDILNEQYKKNTDNILQNEQNNHEEIKLSKYEKNLLVAKDYLVAQAMSIKQISQFTGLKESQVKSLSKRLETTGQIFPFKGKRPSKLNQEQIDFLVYLLTRTNGCISTLSLLKDRLLITYPELGNISLKTIENTIKKEGFSFKKLAYSVDRRFFPRSKDLQKQASKKLITALSQDYKVIFVDETGIKLNSYPNYGWGKKGETVSVQVQVGSQNYSIMAAITDTEILGCQIIEKGGMKKEDFLGFLSTVIKGCIHSTHDNVIVLFLDNAPAHTSPYIQEHLGNQITFLFNAPYSPMLNPIEEFFSKFKRSIKKELITSVPQLLRAVQNALASFTPDDFKGYMRHVLRNASAALQGQDLE